MSSAIAVFSEREELIFMCHRRLPVDRNVVRWPVDDMNGHRVAFSELNRRPWELPIHHSDQCLLAQAPHLRLAHLQVFQQIKYLFRDYCLWIRLMGREMHGSNKGKKSIPILTTNVCSTDAADASGAAPEKKKTMAMAMARAMAAVAASLGRLRYIFNVLFCHPLHALAAWIGSRTNSWIHENDRRLRCKQRLCLVVSSWEKWVLLVVKWRQRRRVTTYVLLHDICTCALITPRGRA